MSIHTSGSRRKIGRVSLYCHHGSWWIYYNKEGRCSRTRVGTSEAQAEIEASLLNARLAAEEAGLALPPTAATGGRLSAPCIGAAKLRECFLQHHERVLNSSLATVSRYRTATLYLVRFAQDRGAGDAMAVDIAGFVEYLRLIRVAPNGHAHSAKRGLRDKGIIYILQCCRSMYHFGLRNGHLPAGSVNPFTAFGIGRLRIRDAKPLFVFDPDQELAFLNGADSWSFAIHATLAKTGMRPGELSHLLIEDVDLQQGWLHVRGKPELGWSVKTGRERRIPLAAPLVSLLRRVVGGRTAGPVFLRQRLAALPELVGGREALAAELRRRLEASSSALADSVAAAPPDRTREAKIAAKVWADAGAVEVDRIRASFVRVAAKAAVPCTCPKAWRHTFATLMQEANVDPLVRQETLGHKPAAPGLSALGMTGVYTHTTPAVQRREIERAVSLRPASLALIEQFVQIQTQIQTHTEVTL